MAKLGMNFDANEVPERDDFSPLPPGRYVGMIVNSEMKDTDKGGQYLQLDVDVMDGEFVGKRVIERLNLKNANETAVKIAYQTFAEICKAIGTLKVADSNQLHNKRFLFDVAVEMGKSYVKDGVEKEGKAQNKIKKYLPYGQGSAAQATASADAPAKKPWE